MEGNVPDMVDCDVLEAAKENVQPLATGRRVTALSAILATPHAQRESKLSATRNRLRINVELALDDEDGDPLEAYCRLVNWTIENYPQGHSVESGLLELLEEATRTLKDDRGGKWRGDLKYLKLWLLYASYVEKPTIIYKFLIANDIGTEFALLYEEHAAVLERDGRRNEADDAYALGIARKASPLDHLESRYIDFQKRMMSNTSRPAPAPAAAAPSQVPRRALATTATSLPASTSRLPSSRSTGASASGSIPPIPNGRLQIFVDPTGEQAQAAENGGNEWNDLGTRKTRIKENVPEVKKLVGTTLKQAGRSKRIAASSGSGTASSGSKIVPFRDPEPSTAAPAAPARAAKAPASKPAAKAFQPFVDDAPEASVPSFKPFRDEVSDAPPARGAKAPAAKPAAKAFLPFVDEAPAPAVPSFTPFRDESEGTSSGTTMPIADSVIKVKEVDKKATTTSTAAEALRKDPLKNYGVSLTP